MLNRIVCIVIALALMVGLAGCAKDAVIYEDEIVCITREKGCICVVDAFTGTEVKLSHRHVKRAESVSERLQDVIKRDGLTVSVAGRLIIVEEDSKTVYIVG